MPLPDRNASGPGKVRSSCRLRQLDARDRSDSAPCARRRSPLGPGRLQTHSVGGDRSAIRSGSSPAGRPGAQSAFGRITEAATMTLRYAVGIKIGNRADQMTVEAEDALIAALKVKTAHPEAAITYVRKRNARGDRRHPHSSQIDENPAGQAAGDALGRGHLSRRSTAPSRRPCPIPCPSLRAGRPLNPSSSRIRPDHRRSRKLTGLQIKKKNPRLRCHPRSSPKCLRLLDRGNRQPSTAVTELSEPGEHLARWTQAGSCGSRCCAGIIEAILDGSMDQRRDAGELE